MKRAAYRLCRLPQKAKRQDESQRQHQKFGIGPGMGSLTKCRPGTGGIGFAVTGLLATGIVFHRDGHLAGQFPARSISANFDGDELRVRSDHVACRHP